MIFIDPQAIRRRLPAGWDNEISLLTKILSSKSIEERSTYIGSCREKTWSHPKMLEALKEIVGNKCWYSEVPLEGADANVDHFRPKGRVKEVDEDFKPTGVELDGYWWLAFDWRNFRLSSMHSNQRRVDTSTEGGKADFFPVVGSRAPENTDYVACVENILPLDPCSFSDVSLLWFDANGAPSCSNWHRKATPEDVRRVKTTIWLYHLDKQEIQKRRREHMEKIRSDLDHANADYRLWKSIPNNVVSKASFDRTLASIRSQLAEDSEFSSAKRCAVRLSSADFEWVLEYNLFA
ncbi:hypothetical protein AO073_12290 [Pseudomonas syringae ICMP 11293]|uniref:hypothetical protein n=1 Tax=Pseudomonas syringae TaxID=317 RepID=UPI00072FD0F5|nr:hypothetical protein [Pseudomonas syringae]KTB89006.1 hypothetical protein AO073_12290 [Pseudomonas syringae ICMP 11293]